LSITPDSQITSVRIYGIVADTQNLKIEPELRVGVLHWTNRSLREDLRHRPSHAILLCYLRPFPDDSIKATPGTADVHLMIFV
jgi:hypothetical protein